MHKALIKSQNKAFIELPDEDLLIEFLKDEIGSNIDQFRAWYRISKKTFTSIDPLFGKDYVQRSRIATLIYTLKSGKLVYHIGEINDLGKSHGVGLMIVPFELISEAYYQSGYICGRQKYLMYHVRPWGEIQFRKFMISSKMHRKTNGYYQELTKNGDVTQEGYCRSHKYGGEIKSYSDNSKKYVNSRTAWAWKLSKYGKAIDGHDNIWY